MLYLVSQDDEKQTPPMTVTELRAENYSTDGKVVIALRTRYSPNEWKYSIPVECFLDLIIDLKRLNCVPPTQAPPTQPDKPTEPVSLLPEVSIISE
jgi:hypothetical protein